MKYLIYILFLLGFSFSVKGQTQPLLLKGTVSYVSSRNVYVKFASTEKINIGDTLFIQQNEELIPALIVQNKSSNSSVCTPLLSEKMKVGTELFAKTIFIEEVVKAEKEVEEVEEPTSIAEKINVTETNAQQEEQEEEKAVKQKIKARISAASYNSLSDYRNNYRMRYAFSFRGDHLNKSKFSTDTYITFRHTIGEWAEVKENLNRALKIYSLAVRYDIDKSSSLTLGRKINPKISNMGAIDGLQFEKGAGKFLFGAIAGSRPDHTDYNLNFNLLQMGAYVAYVSKTPTKYQQSTLGFAEQHNKGSIDRRFVYFQHTGELMKNLNLFSSFEMDLYQKINTEVKNTLQLTNLYVSLRYRISKKLKLSASYDNRKNIIYYESFKNYIDQLIDDETRQGLRLGFNYRPFKYISWGVNSSLRFQKNNANVSRNLNSYITYSKIPILNMRGTLNVNFLQTNYLNSRIFGLQLSKELIKRKLNGDIYYRMVDYQYKSGNTTVHQNVVGTSLSLRLIKNLTWYVYYEGTFDDKNKVYHRINTKIIQRF